MKRNIIITIILFLFSILYIKNAVYMIRENDILLKEIKSKQEKYNILPITPIITKHTVILGINGKKINIKKSYNNMKGINKFRESLIIFDEIKTNEYIKNIYDKVLLLNPRENKISILTNLDNAFCYSENLSIEEHCIKEKKHTILIYKISKNYLTNIKKNLRNGIVFFLDSINQNELNLVKRFIISNNYEIIELSKLVSF